MRNNETGEYELVVGNKQLLSGFFIVVLLCAVAFAMGYVVGENSHATKPVETASTAKPVETRPETPPAAPAADTRAATPEPASPPPSDPAPETRSAPPEAAPQPTTKPAREIARPREPQADPEPPRRKEEPPAAESKAAGSYWQVAATNNRDSAETLLQTLKGKGFPCTLGPGPNNLTRVLVGPYSDTTALGRAKTELEAAGFSHMVRK